MARYRRHFSTAWLTILWEIWSDVFSNFYKNSVTNVFLDKEVPTKCWKSSGVLIRCPRAPDRIRFGWDLCSILRLLLLLKTFLLSDVGRSFIRFCQYTLPDNDLSNMLVSEPQGQYWAGRTPPPNNPPPNMAAANFVVMTNREGCA